jgi:sugar/nucleoside kinase (ribokinase family)
MLSTASHCQIIVTDQKEAHFVGKDEHNRLLTPYGLKPVHGYANAAYLGDLGYLLNSNEPVRSILMEAMKHGFKTVTILNADGEPMKRFMNKPILKLVEQSKLKV